MLAQKTAKEATSPKPLDTSERPRTKTPGSGIPPPRVEVSAAIPAKGISTRTASTAHSAAMTAQIATYTASAAAASASTTGTQMGENTASSTMFRVRLPVLARAMARDGRGFGGDLRRDFIDRTQVCHRLGFGKAVFHAIADGLVVERERLLDFGVRQLAQRPLELG